MLKSSPSGKLNNPYGKKDEQNFYQRISDGEKLKNRSKEYVRPDLEDGK
ncbi:hypothetical protein N9Z37_00570 [bacterium]|nr:hypothetical protein [bacterium]